MKTKDATESEKNQNDRMLVKKTAERIIVKSKPARLSRRLKKKLNAERIDEAANGRLEKHIPLLAKVATARAYRQTLASGGNVLIAEAGELKEISPDGTIRNMKSIEPPVKMRKGQIIEIK